MRVLVLKPYPDDTAASQRFRFEQYEEFLAKNHITCIHAPFLNKTAWQSLYRKGHIFTKISAIITGYIHRFFLLTTLFKFQYVFIHREAAPLGPPLLEWIIAKFFKKPIIYDFDDAIWLPNTSSANRFIAGMKWHPKVQYICKWSHKVSCGNEYLAKFAKKFNRQVQILPTTIDTVFYHNKVKNQASPGLVIGWTGSHSTLKYLEPLMPVLQQLQQYYTFQFWIIADQAPDFDLPFIKFFPWNKANEIEALLNFHIGVMPLPNNAWGLGKCGFKILQYMALGIPTVADAVGTNKSIIESNENGYLCFDDQDWFYYLDLLLSNRELRNKMGHQGRQTVLDRYSVNSNQPKYLELFH